jgi:hypothetical protein
MITDCPPLMLEAMQEEKPTSITHEDGRHTYYFPIKTSAGDVVGALELTEGWKEGGF